MISTACGRLKNDKTGDVGEIVDGAHLRGIPRAFIS
jgi:hypothetical protein